MTGQAIKAAATTGAFCVVFALFIDRVTEALSLWQIVVASFASGSMGSLFASILLRRRDE